MEEKDVIATLCKLEEMDRDAIGIYEDAIGKTADDETKRKLEEFRKDHERHVQAIGSVLREQDWRHVEATQEFRTLMQAYRREVDMAEGGDDAVVVAMDVGEKATNAEYAEALRMDVDRRVRQVLQNDFADEQRHLRFIESRMPPSLGGGVGRLHAEGGPGGRPAGSGSGD